MYDFLTFTSSELLYSISLALTFYCPLEVVNFFFLFLGGPLHVFQDTDYIFSLFAHQNWTALHTACYFGNVGVVRLLLQTHYCSPFAMTTKMQLPAHLLLRCPLELVSSKEACKVLFGVE